MKRHDRQNSLDFKLTTNPANNAPLHKVDTFSKIHNKRYQVLEAGSINTTYNIYTNTAKLKLSETKRQPQSKIHIRKSSQKRSLNKLSSERSQQKLPTSYQFTLENKVLTTRSKLLKLNNIMSIRLAGDSKDILKLFLAGNQECNSLVRQWKKLEIFDQIDGLISALVQKYTNIVESIIAKNCTEIIDKIEQYQRIIQKLTTQNDKMKNFCQFQTQHLDNRIIELESKIFDEYQKNQWTTFILNQLQLNGINMDKFIRNSNIYQKWKLSNFENLLSSKELEQFHKMKPQLAEAKKINIVRGSQTTKSGTLHLLINNNSIS